MSDEQDEREQKYQRAQRKPSTMHEAPAYLREFNYWDTYYHESLRALCIVVQSQPDHPITLEP